MSSTLADKAAESLPDSIGAVDAVHYTPADSASDEDDRATVIRILASLAEDELDAIKRHIDLEREDAVKGVQLRIFSLVSRVISFILPPKGRFEPVNLWGLVYALDDADYHGNEAPASKARTLGVTRAAMSHAMRHAAAMLGLTGRNASRWMRSDDTQRRSFEARNESHKRKKKGMTE